MGWRAGARRVLLPDAYSISATLKIDRGPFRIIPERDFFGDQQTSGPRIFGDA